MMIYQAHTTFTLSRKAALACVAFVALLGANLAQAAVAATSERIAAFEVLEPGTVMAWQQAVESRQKKSRHGGKSQPMTLAFSAFGRHWQWQVQDNARLLEKLGQNQRQRLSDRVSLWQGVDLHHPAHWLRFSLWHDPSTGQTELHGMWWDGSELYLLSPVGQTALATAAAKRGRDADTTVAYRLSDVIPSEPLACGVNNPVGSGEGPGDGFNGKYQQLLADLKQKVAETRQPDAATSQLNVAIVADTFYQNHWGNNTTASILNLMNNVDGIYSNQIGVTLNVAQILTLNDNGPMTATDSGVLLPQFRDWVGAGNLTNPGLAHLFTSRNLDGNIKGRAYVNVLCAGKWGTGIDEIVGNSYETIIVAHEMGHNFGADHDGDSNGSCPNEPPNTYIMSPTVSASYTDFSPCSASVVTTNAGVASCIVPVGNDVIFAHGFE